MGKNNEFKSRLRARLESLDVFYSVSEDQVRIRCPFCGDSRKSDSSANFYVKINSHVDEPVLFHCFRADCQASGILTPAILRSMDINDLQLNSSLLSYNNTAMKQVNKALGIKDNTLKFEVPVYTNSNDSSILAKQDYVNGRLGLNLSLEEMAKLKIIFHLGHFLYLNDVKDYTRDKYMVERLHKEYVGFLTTRNEFINFRNIREDVPHQYRYHKYSIYKNLDNTRKFYTIPTDIDLLSPDPIVIHIAEGSFDILGIYYHIYGGNAKNQIFVAVNGASYASVIKYFIQMGVIGNIIVNIYSDDNVKPHQYVPIVEEMKPWVSEFNLFYNEIFTNDKADYGVHAHQIQLRKGVIR